jgi:hypothetical protein
VVGIAAVIVVAVLVPPLFVPEGLGAKDAAEIENNVRGTLLQGLLGAAFLLAAYFTWRQVQIAERGQITERFKNATDQLGSDTPDVRLGGIYSMEQIARDNPKTYRILMVEILSAFVRRRSHLADFTENEGALPVDMEAALKVLARRERRTLERADLTRAMFSTANLSGMDLSGVDLSRTDLTDAKLTSADLFVAKLTRAKLTAADLTAADLTAAKLTAVAYDDETMWPDGFEPPGPSS